MKKLSLLISCFLVFLCTKSIAQAQWKFHLAFEDATGAKDTIWCIWDTSATGGISGQYDSHLGEGAYPFDYNVFNVWILNDNFDSTKTFAYPFYYTTLSLEIHAFNHQYPITISWDSSLFHSPSLLSVGYVNKAVMDNDYFFVVNNDPPLQKFNMLLDNSIIAPAFYWGAQSHFPLKVGIMRGATTGLEEDVIPKNKLLLIPNPSSDNLMIKSEFGIKSYSLLSSDGKVLISSIMDNVGVPPKEVELLVSSLASGLYSLIVTNHKNQTYHEKVVVIH